MDTVAEGEFDRSQLLPEDGLKLEPSETPEDSKPPEPEIAILTSGKLLIIPESVYDDFPGVKGFKVDREKGRIVLTPIPPSDATIDEIRRHIAAQGITEQDVTDAVKWARARRRRFRRCWPAGRPGLS